MFIHFGKGGAMSHEKKPQPQGHLRIEDHPLWGDEEEMESKDPDSVDTHVLDEDEEAAAFDSED